MDESEDGAEDQDLEEVGITKVIKDVVTYMPYLWLYTIYIQTVKQLLLGLVIKFTVYSSALVSVRPHHPLSAPATTLQLSSSMQPYARSCM